MKLTIFAAVVLLLMTSVVVMIQARSVTSQVGGIQQYLKVSLCHSIVKLNVEFRVHVAGVCSTQTLKLSESCYTLHVYEYSICETLLNSCRKCSSRSLWIAKTKLSTIILHMHVKIVTCMQRLLLMYVLEARAESLGCFNGLWDKASSFCIMWHLTSTWLDIL